MPPAPRYQENAHDINDDACPEYRAKFEVGARLRYLGPCDHIPPEFAPGDVVTVVERNGCGMGIDVIGPQNKVDMVWPWEVALADQR